MAEFADFYRAGHTYTQPECALWRDILYGSDKQYFWHADPYLRCCLDMNQGGAMIDLRPYVAKLYWPVGIGTPHVQDASYPFLIQANCRAGYFTHYAGEGTIRSCKLTHKGEEVDLCLTRTWAHFEKKGGTRVLTLDPVEIKFADLTVTLQTEFEFEEGSGAVKTTRCILESSDPAAKVELNEYITACYGTTEYPEDMTSVALGLKNGSEERGIRYAYRCREDEMAGGEASALVPPVETLVTLAAAGEHTAYYKEGYAFSPMFTLGAKSEIGQGEEMVTWLRLEKAN